MVLGNHKNKECRLMGLIAPVVYQGGMLSLEFVPESSVTTLNLFALQGIRKLKTTFTKQVGSDKWTAMLAIPSDAATGEYQWQLWGDDKIEASGTFSIAQGFTDDTTESEKTPNEQRLEQVQKAIDRLMTTGVAAYGISGSYTTRLSLNHLNQEKFRLQDLVNRERRSRGLPYLPGTLARTYTQFMES